MACALEPYLRVYTADINPRFILEFLLFDEDFPRSIRFCTARIQDLLTQLLAQAGAGRSDALRLAGRLDARLKYADLEEVEATGAGALLAAVVGRMRGDPRGDLRDLRRLPPRTEPARLMLLEVRHVTQYHYAGPVRESVMELWMQPQKSATPAAGQLRAGARSARAAVLLRRQLRQRRLSFRRAPAPRAAGYRRPLGGGNPAAAAPARRRSTAANGTGCAATSSRASASISCGRTATPAMTAPLAGSSTNGGSTSCASSIRSRAALRLSQTIYDAVRLRDGRHRAPTARSTTRWPRAAASARTSPTS